MTGRNAVEVNMEKERFKVVYSGCRLADNIKEFYSNACHTCSTIIVPHSTNQIILFVAGDVVVVVDVVLA
mgnify:CR=1 FL=1